MFNKDAPTIKQSDRPALEERLRSILIAYASGDSLQTIGEHHNLTRQRVHKLLKTHGLQMRNTSGARTAKTGAIIAEMFREGNSVKRVAAELARILGTTTKRDMIL